MALTQSILRMATGQFRVRYLWVSGLVGLGSGMISHPWFFGFGAPKPIGFGFGFSFPLVDIQWIFKINHLELKLMFFNMLIITCLLRLLNLF
jgi:hypothetical protein